MMRVLLATLVLISCGNGGAKAEKLLPGLLDLPKIEKSTVLEDCNYWFRDASIYNLELIEGEVCLATEDAEVGNDQAFSYWRKLQSLGWADLTGGGNELWAYNYESCLRATISLFPSTEPVDDHWAEQKPVVIWIRAERMVKCDS